MYEETYYVILAVLIVLLICLGIYYQHRKKKERAQKTEEHTARGTRIKSDITGDKAGVKEADVPFWAFALSTAHFPYPVATIQSLRLQFYTDLAYGAQGLQYFTYWCPTPGIWDFNNAPISETGQRTPAYDLVKYMNRELQARAEVFMGAKVLSVCHTGATLPPGVKPLTELPSCVKSLDTKGKGAVVSHFENGGWEYLMIVNRSLDEAFDYEIGFNEPAKMIGRNGKVSNAKDGTYHLEEGDCAILR